VGYACDTCQTAEHSAGGLGLTSLQKRASACTVAGHDIKLTGFGLAY
jgi:hypothetical protein